MPQSLAIRAHPAGHKCYGMLVSSSCTSTRSFVTANPIIIGSYRLLSSGSSSSVPRATTRRNAHESAQTRRSDDDNHKTTKGSLVDAATEYLSSLRFLAAKTLASAMSSTEREQFLSQLGAVDEHRVKEDTRKSVGEAVAEAVAKESKRTELIREKEREEIRKKAEEAAMERVKSDLLIQERKIALERWKKEVEREKRLEEEKEEEKRRVESAVYQQQQQQQQEQHVVNGFSNLSPPDKQLPRMEEHDNHHHPILGPPLADLGYKRVHVVPAKALAAIPIWEKQRVYRHDRAKAMAADKLKTPELGLPGIISLHEANDGHLSILDGQHRVGMMAILREKDGWAETVRFDLERVLVEVFPHKNGNDDDNDIDDSTKWRRAEDIFIEINKAEPVKLVDMPGVARGNERKIINDAAERLRENYQDMFKPSQRCRPPHLNVDNLRDALFTADVLKRHSIKSQKALVDWMMAKNEELSKKFESEAPTGVSERASEKARQYGFFLGLDSSWLYQ